MKIAHVITGLNDGGAEAVLYRLCTNDPLSSHIVISLMDEGKYGPLLRAAGIPLVCINLQQGKITIQGLIKLWRVLRAAKADTVQTWMYHSDLVGGVAARFAGIKNVCWGIHHSNLAPGTIKDSTRKIAKICAKLSHVIPNRIVSCSRAAAAIHEQLGYSATKFRIVPNGYDISLYIKDELARGKVRCELEIGPETVLMGMVARFDPQKDHHNLLEALSLLLKKSPAVDLKVALVGAGMDSENLQLKKLIHDYDLQGKILLLGQRRDIPSVMNALDLHVLSSLGEAFPNVLSEAMACGTPCVTTDVGDAALIVGDTGWIVAPRDSAELACALKEAVSAISDKSAWAKRQLAAREHIVSNFCLEKMVQSYNEVWKEY